MDKLSALRAKMAQRGIDAYIVPTADDHESEYVGEHYKARAYLTGFTGSAGVCAVTREDAALWTDGRYFIQAAREIAGSGFRLMKMGEPGVPTLAEYLRGALPGGGTLGFDGRVVNAALAQELAGAVEGARLCTDCDLVGEIWQERPPRSASAAFLLPLERAGRSAAEKLAEFRADLQSAGADAAILTALDEIAWLFNLRGHDIACTPYLLAFAAVEPERALLFAQEGVFAPEQAEALKKEGVEIAPYDAIYDYAAARPAGSTVSNRDSSLVKFSNALSRTSLPSHSVRRWAPSHRNRQLVSTLAESITNASFSKPAGANTRTSFSTGKRASAAASAARLGRHSSTLRRVPRVLK